MRILSLLAFCLALSTGFVAGCAPEESGTPNPNAAVPELDIVASEALHYGGDGYGHAGDGPTSRNCSVPQRRIVWSECDYRCGGGWFGARKIVDGMRDTENQTVGYIGACKCWSGELMVIDRYMNLDSI